MVGNYLSASQMACCVNLSKICRFRQKKLSSRASDGYEHPNFKTPSTLVGKTARCSLAAPPIEDYYLIFYRLPPRTVAARNNTKRRGCNDK